MFIFFFKPINLFHYGQFRKMGLFTIYDRTSKSQFSGKLFYFDQILVYTEFVDLRLKYRGHYLGDDFGICEYDSNGKFCLFAKKLGMQEVEFRTCFEQLNDWYNVLSKALMGFVNAGKNL
jgi:hypothetical protein